MGAPRAWSLPWESSPALPAARGPGFPRCSPSCPLVPCSSTNEENWSPLWTGLPLPCLSSHPPLSFFDNREEKFPGAPSAKRTLKVRPQSQARGVEFPNASSLMSRGPFGHCTLPCFVGLGLLKGFSVMVSVEASAGKEGIRICRGFNPESPKTRVYHTGCEYPKFSKIEDPCQNEFAGKHFQIIFQSADQLCLQACTLQGTGLHVRPAARSTEEQNGNKSPPRLQP